MAAPNYRQIIRRVFDSVTDTLGVSGPVAHDAADAGNPIKIGGVYRTSIPAVAAGDIVDFLMTAEGRSHAVPWIPGASDVKTKVVAIGATSASINTAIDPTSGKKIRVISLNLAANDATAPDLVGVYFGTGATYLTNPASAIHQFKMEAFGDRFVSWPDGGGPVGAADDNLSWITQTEIGTIMNLTIVYREE